MSMLTDFFVASKEALELNFVDWLPVAAEKISKINPFTNEPFVDWGPDPDALALYNAQKKEAIAQKDERPQGVFGKLFRQNKSNPSEIHIPDITQFPYVKYTRVDLIKLASLFALLSSITFDEALNQLEKPAYVIPDYDEQGIHILPENYLKYLINIEKSRLPILANQWWQTEELQSDGFTEEDSQEVLLNISQLASIAISEQKNLFHWWCI